MSIEILGLPEYPTTTVHEAVTGQPTADYNNRFSDAQVRHDSLSTTEAIVGFGAVAIFVAGGLALRHRFNRPVKEYFKDPTD